MRGPDHPLNIFQGRRMQFIYQYFEGPVRSRFWTKEDLIQLQECIWQDDSFIAAHGEEEEEDDGTMQQQQSGEQKEAHTEQQKKNHSHADTFTHKAITPATFPELVQEYLAYEAPNQEHMFTNRSQMFMNCEAGWDCPDCERATYWRERGPKIEAIMFAQHCLAHNCGMDASL